MSINSPTQSEIEPGVKDATAKTKRKRRDRAIRGRLMFYGGLLAAIWAFYVWQPYQFDLIPRKPPQPLPPVDPDSILLFSGKAKVLIVCGHPDDSSFFTGGLLLRLAQTKTEIHQVICTDGDKGYYPFEDWRLNRRIRRQEALDEAAVWGGKDILFLGQPDGRLRNSPEVVDAIKRTILRVKPDYILCFDGEYPARMSHNDHRRSGEAAFQAAKESGRHMWVMMFQTGAPNYVADITNQWSSHQDLLAIHKSQFNGDHLFGIIAMVGSHAESDGRLRGYEMGEGFRCVWL